MAARTAAAPVLVVTATLHIDTGELVKGRWVRQPTATYTCNRCWYRETVTGPERVRAFTAHIRHTHRQACPSAANHERTAA